MKYKISDSKEVRIYHNGLNIEIAENHPIYTGSIYINTYTPKEIVGLRDLMTKFINDNNLEG